MKQLSNQKHPEWSTEPKERMSYYLYFCGQNMIYNLVALFLPTYLLFQGINPVKTAGVMLAVKVWDAVNDAIFGCIFDSVHFKSKKKFLPWLRISLPFIPLTTILMFVIPHGSSETIQLVWFAVAYVLWDTAYTLCDVPIYGIVTAMTEHLDERTSLLSYKSIWAGVGYAVAFVLATYLPGQKVGLSFGFVSVIIAILAFATMLPICRVGQERFEGEKDQDFTIGKMFKYLFSNKYLLLYYGGYFFMNALSVTGSLNMFAAYYLFNNEQFTLLVGVLSAAPMLVFSLLVPKILAKHSKMNVYMLCSVLTVIISVVTWLFGYKNVWIFIGLSVLRSIPFGIISVMMFFFTPDCAEYGYFKTGFEAKGITFAIQTFMVKLTAAISSALALFLLGAFGWKTVKADSFKELAQSGITQSVHTLNGLWLIYVLIPAIGFALAMIVWHFYKMTDKDVQIITSCNCGKISREEAIEQLSIKEEFEVDKTIK